MKIKDLSNIVTSLLPVWVLLFGITGYLSPKNLAWLKPYIEWLFIFTMLGIGTILDYKEFLSVWEKPQYVFLGTLAQFGIMPITGWSIAKILNLSPELSLGIIITGSVPGAMASNVISYLAKADVSYSISLTTISTLLSPLLTPTFVLILGRSWLKIDFWPMFFSIIKMVVLPLIIGGVIKKYFFNLVKKISFIPPLISTISISLICGLVVALNQNVLKTISLIVFTAVFLHNFLGLLLGYIAGVIYNLDIKRKRTLAIEVGMQNAGLGAVLSLKHFSELTALPNAMFATWCVITASILAYIWSSKIKS